MNKGYAMCSNLLRLVFAVVVAVLLGNGLLGVKTAFALASAMEHSADLITGDPEFKMVEHLVNVIRV